MDLLVLLSSISPCSSHRYYIILIIYVLFILLLLFDYIIIYYDGYALYIYGYLLVITPISVATPELETQYVRLHIHWMNLNNELPTNIVTPRQFKGLQALKQECSNCIEWMSLRIIA